MKFFALVFVIFAVMSTTFALKHPVCGLPHSKEHSYPCRAYMPSFTYRADTNECIRFIYGGCNGNANRFSTQKECEAKCKE